MRNNPARGAKDHRRFDAVIFDLGSTLLYFEGEWPQVMSKANDELFQSLQDAGLQLDRQQFLEEFQKRLHLYYVEREAEFIEYTTAYVLKSLLEEMGEKDIDEAILRPALNAMYSVSGEHWQVEADALPTLSILKNRGYNLGLISNAGDDEDVQSLVDKAGIRHFFEVVVTSAALGIRKPNPLIFHKVLDRLKIEPARAVMVGDRLGADILGARNAGIYSILITRRADTVANRAHADTIIPDATIRTLSELPAILEGEEPPA